MSQAEELLNSMALDESSTTLSTSRTSDSVIIIDDSRRMVVPEELKKLAVQYDHNIETVTFVCPRYWDGHDLSKMLISIEYERPDHESDSNSAENLICESNGTTMRFDWTIRRHLSEVAGNLKVQVCIRLVNKDSIEERHWNTEVCEDFYVSPGLDCGSEMVIDDHPKRIIILTDQTTGIDYEVYVRDGNLMMKER